MACKEDPKHLEKITFLYKFTKGECPKSFGMNVAIISGLDRKIIDYAIKLSKDFMKIIS
jgi:DNA mismatch repair protein MSH6